MRVRVLAALLLVLVGARANEESGGSEEESDGCAVVDTKQSSTWQPIPGDEASAYSFSWRVQVLDWTGTMALKIVWPRPVELKNVFGADLITGSHGSTTWISLGPMAPAHNTIQLMGTTEEGGSEFGPGTTQFVCRGVEAPPPAPPYSLPECDLNPTYKSRRCRGFQTSSHRVFFFAPPRVLARSSQHALR